VRKRCKNRGVFSRREHREESPAAPRGMREAEITHVRGMERTAQGLLLPTSCRRNIDNLSGWRASAWPWQSMPARFRRSAGQTLGVLQNA